MNIADDWFIQAVIIRNETEKNIVKFIHETTSPAVPAGTNYLSQVSRTKVTVLRQSGKKDKITLIVKRLPEGEGSEGRAEFVKQSGAFKMEIMVYCQLLKAMESIMIEADDTEIKLWGEMIGYNPNDCIVFEDLSVQGFKMTESRHEYLDLDHTLVVMQAIGRFHALSKVLLKKRLVSRDDLPPFHLIANSKNTEIVMNHCLKQFGSHIKTWGSEWEEIGNTLIDYSHLLHEKVVGVGRVPNDSKLMVMNHGDLWKNNILFKYARYSKKVIDLRLLDFQLSHFNTLSWDLIYFLFGSVHPEVRRNHFDLLLELYVHEMKITAAHYGLPVDEISEISDIKADMDRLLPMRVIVTFFFRLVFVSRYMIDLDAIMMNVELDDTIGQDPRSISDPLFKDNSALDLKELASEIRKKNSK